MSDPRKDVTTAPISAPIAASSDSSSSDAGSLGRSTAIEAGAAGASGGFACPAPASGDGFVSPNSPRPAWARDLASGNCCYYEDGFLAPEGWARFDSQSECASSCRCADVEAANPDNPNDPPDVQAELRKVTRESISLECFCSAGAGFTCYRTLEEAQSTLCAHDAAPAYGGVTQRSGCGLVELDISGGFVGGSWVFDATTGALVGAEVFSDEESRPCLSFTTRGGRAFSCSDTITECQLCGDTNSIISSQPLGACP